MVIQTEVELTSPAFQEGEIIPRRYTGDGENISPPLKWLEPPEGTECFAVICDDPDVPRKVWTHWVVFNIPAPARELEEAIPRVDIRPNGLMQGRNDFNEIGYDGPSPPPGRAHHYYFHLYALDMLLNLRAGASKQELLTAMDGHILAQSQLVGIYGRP